MNARRLGGLVAAAALLGPAAPALAQTAPSTTYYFGCGGASKVQNGVSLAIPVQWSTTKPATSFTAGGGCGFADVPAVGGVRPSSVPNNAYDAFYTGPAEMAIASARIELHNLVTSRARQGETVTLLVRISEGSGTTATTVKEKEFTVKPVLSSTNASESVTVEFTNLNVKASAGRSLNITVHSLSEAPQAWVHGAAEIPANVVFTEPLPTP